MRALLITFCFIASAIAAERPNIIIFLVDDWGIMDTSVPMLVDHNGDFLRHELNDFYRTPNMERLAKTGIRFSEFYAHSVCSPSRVSILTGQNSTRHRTTQWIRPSGNNAGKYGPKEWGWVGLNEQSITLPRVLQNNGYRTIHVGKAHFGPKKHAGRDPSNLGFDINIAGDAFGAPGSYYSKDHYGAKGKKTDKAVPHLEAYFDQDIYLTEALTLEAKREITESVKARQPFFLHLSHYAVHSPFQSDPRFINNYADSSRGAKSKTFASMVEGVDKSLGDIMDTISQLGIGDNTLLILLGDNGTDAPHGGTHEIGCAAPLRAKKGTHYEGGLRIPFMMSWLKPNSKANIQGRLPIAAGGHQGQLATIMDIYPTILNLTGAKNPSGHVVDGVDLASLSAGKADPNRQEIFLTHFPHDHRSSNYTSYRHGDWKVIYHYFPGEGKGKTKFPQYELFNLQRDPTESMNLASTHPEQLAALMTAMVKQMEAEGALWPEVDGAPVRPVMP